MKKISINNRHKYTILTMLLTVIISLGSMAGVNLILRARERQFLSEQGEMLAETTTNEWQKHETISIEQMEEAISCWDESNMIAHAPVNRQISMEEAVKAGKVWLTQMDFIGYRLAEDEKSEVRSVYATLGSQKELKELQINPYYSFWKVNISGNSLDAILYVNALTAGVWRAELTFYEDLPEEMPYWKLKDYIELSGLKPYYKGAVCNEEGTEATWKIEDSQLYAWMDFSYRDARGYRKNLTGIDNVVINKDVITRENIRINIGLETQ